MRTWERPTQTTTGPSPRPWIDAPSLLGVDRATIQRIAANVEPYIRADGTSVWSLMQLERQLDPDAFGPRWNGGHLTRRRPRTPSP